MKAPAIPTRNPLAARHLAVQGPGISVEQQNIQGQQQPAAMAGAIGQTLPSVQANGAMEAARQQFQAVNTQQHGVNQALGSMQAEMAGAPQGAALVKPPNMTAAAELMTPEQKAQALAGLHRERIIMAAEEAAGAQSRLRKIG